MKLTILTLLFLTFSFIINAQDLKTTNSDSRDYYYQIPDNPNSYTSGNVSARMIDGLGFRYYWATESLRNEDLKYKPNDDARTIMETLDHIYGLTRTIVNALSLKPNVRTAPETLTFEEKRLKTLENIKIASEILKESTDKDLEKYDIIFKNENRTSEYPFWNLLNGPVADALWHVGQVVSLRRSSGNPFNSKVNVFSGKLRED